jgi:hypothetical protein
MEVVNPEEISLDDDDAREEEQLPADEESGAAVDETGETFVGRFAGTNQSTPSGGRWYKPIADLIDQLNR